MLNGDGRIRCVELTDISDSAFLGSSNGKNFLAPVYSKYGVIIVDEIAKYVGGNSELFQTFLSVLENRTVTRRLLKFAEVSGTEKKRAEEIYGIKWLDNCTFEAPVRSVFLGCTYDNSFLDDPAFQSRFNIIVPEKELDGTLNTHIKKYGPTFCIPEEISERLRYFLRAPMMWLSGFEYEVPDEISGLKGMTPRKTGELMRYGLARKWWGLDTSLPAISQAQQKMMVSQKHASQNRVDTVINLITKMPYTVKKLVEATGFSKSALYRILSPLPTSKEDTQTGAKGYYLEDN